MKLAEDNRLDLYQKSKQLQNEALVKSSEIAELQERLEKAKLQTAIEEGNKAHRQDSVCLLYTSPSPRDA